MHHVEYTLIIVNLVAGLGCAFPLARFLSQVNNKPIRFFRYFTILIGIYFVECVAIATGMGIPVFSVCLAFVWGVVFGFWLRYRASIRQVLKASFFLSLYTSLPAASFIIIPVMVWIGGQNILSAEVGARFGIPDFLHLPWPVNTILGFYAVLVIGAVVFKMIITTGEVSLLIHLGEKSAKDSS
jgi:hypothetical protein